MRFAGRCMPRLYGFSIYFSSNSKSFLVLGVFFDFQLVSYGEALLHVCQSVDVVKPIVEYWVLMILSAYSALIGVTLCGNLSFIRFALIYIHP